MPLAPPPPPILFFRCANPVTDLLPGGADPALVAPKSVSALMDGLDLDTDMSGVLVLWSGTVAHFSRQTLTYF